MHSLSLDINNSDLSQLPLEDPKGKKVQLSDSEISGCPRCC